MSVLCLQEYIDRTTAKRTALESQPLFISYVKPFKPVTRPTLTKWVLKMLQLAGIDTKLFQAHSVRAAASSKVAALGLKLSDILAMGNWAQESTWQKFYHKSISSPTKRFQRTLLSGTDHALKEDSPKSDRVFIDKALHSA